MAKRNATLSPESQTALSEFNELATAHKKFVSQYLENKKAYEAEIPTMDETDWWDNIAPPVAEHIIETTIASMLDEQFSFQVKPTGRLFQDSDSIQKATDGAKALHLLLTQQLKQDHFDEKQRPLVLQERLAGLSPMKVYWRTEGDVRMRTKWSTDPLTGESVWDRVEEPKEIRDGPCTEIVDIRDFFWDTAATTLEGCQMVAHRTWPSLAECKRMERNGRWRNVDEMTREKERDMSQALNERDLAADPDKKRGRLEVVEIYRRMDNGKIKIFVIGERDVELAVYDLPFDHGEFPFVLFVGQSKLFSINGRPQIEKIADLQKALWVIQNQRLQNLILIDNGVVIYNEDLVDDVGDFDVYPGAQWGVHGDAQAAIQSWNPNPTPAQISIPAESMIKADMQNLGGGFPFTSTSEASNVNASTATEASLVASLAQRSIIEAKRHLYEAYKRMGQMWISLNQQYTREPVYAMIVGADDQMELAEILPAILEGDYVFDIQPMTESLMRQERRAEMLSMFTTVMPTVQIGAMTGAMINTRKLYELVFESYDIRDIDSMFKPPPPAAAPGAPPGAPPGAQVPGMGTPPAMNSGPPGVTAPELAAGMTSPSNGASMSPVAAMQQFGADNTPRNA